MGGTLPRLRGGPRETVSMAWPRHPVLTLLLRASDMPGALVTLLGLGRAQQALADFSGPGPTLSRQEGVLNTCPGAHSQWGGWAEAPGGGGSSGHVTRTLPPNGGAVSCFPGLGRWHQNRMSPSLPGHLRKWIHLACGF